MASPTKPQDENKPHINTPLDLSVTTTHDLWVESRKITIGIERPSDTTIKITVTRPRNLQVVDGCVVMLSENPISTNDYPQDSTQYEPSKNWLLPKDKMMGGAHVVDAYYGFLGTPLPVSDTGEAGVDPKGSTYTFSVTVENTDPNTLYYAAVFGASNILQYYQLGIHSYPLEGSMLEKAVGNYAGNIPSYPSPPTSPYKAMVYHDQTLNLTMFWDEVDQIWIPTRADSIVSGPYNPGTPGQVYLLSGSRLKLFTTEWIDATATNLSVRSSDPADPWKPFNTSRAATKKPDNPTPGDFFYNYTTERYEFYDGKRWVFPNTTNTLIHLPDGTMFPGFIAPPTVEPEELRSPDLGQLFYNTTAKALNAFDGKVWTKVNTDQDGTPLSDKRAIGNDGTYDERARLIKVLAGQMGWPTQCVELKEEQFNIAVDNALDTYRQLSSGAYRRAFVLYKLIPNQQLYFLNSAMDKTDSIVDVHQIHRVGALGFFGGGPNDVWAQAFAQQFYNLTAGTGDLLSTFLIQNYSEELTRMFAGNLMFQWNESTRELYFTRAIREYETVIIECELERTEQELMSDRWCKQFLQNYALAEVKMMLGMIRSKFSSGTPGAAGSITLNGELLIAEARQDMLELKEGLLAFEYGDNVGHGNTAFLIG